MMIYLINFLITIHNVHLWAAACYRDCCTYFSNVLTTLSASFWGRYASTYSLFWPEQLPLWHPRCIASLTSTTTVLEDLKATLMPPYPTRFVCVFTHDFVTYGVMATTLFMCMLVAYVLYSLAWRFLGFGNPIGFYWSTLFTHPFKVPVSMFSERTRTAFNNTTLRAPRLMDNHSHPGQAALRSSAVLALRTLAFSVGMKPYFVQRSKSDNRSGLEGCETVVWAKDAHRNLSLLRRAPNTSSCWLTRPITCRAWT